ncbi:MAG: hypothetical protein ACXAC6_04205 [Candidatus Hodarchaeales archaeon]|jgi:hypothetical protein
MVRYVVKTTLILFVIMLSLGIYPSTQTEIMYVNTVAAQSESPPLVIQQVNLEVEKEGEYFPLDALIIDDPTIDDQLRTPQFLNKSAIRVNATYSTIIGNSESIAVHSFAVDVYEVITGAIDNFTVQAGIALYNFEPPEKVVLPPNSSKSEIIDIESLTLPIYGFYKFVFRVQYHIFNGSQATIETYFAHNMSFELVESLPEPPYVILIIFYALAFVLIAFVLLGIYGNRKYKDLDV